MKSKSNLTNVVILGRPLMKKSWKVKLQDDMEKIGALYNSPSIDVTHEVPEYSREAYYD